MTDKRLAEVLRKAITALGDLNRIAYEIQQAYDMPGATVIERINTLDDSVDANELSDAELVGAFKGE